MTDTQRRGRQEAGNQVGKAKATLTRERKERVPQSPSLCDRDGSVVKSFISYDNWDAR